MKKIFSSKNKKMALNAIVPTFLIINSAFMLIRPGVIYSIKFKLLEYDVRLRDLILLVSVVSTIIHGIELMRNQKGKYYNSLLSNVGISTAVLLATNLNKYAGAIVSFAATLFIVCNDHDRVNGIKGDVKQMAILVFYSATSLGLFAMNKALDSLFQNKPSPIKHFTMFMSTMTLLSDIDAILNLTLKVGPHNNI